VKAERKLPESGVSSLAKLSEGSLILALTELDPDQRPTAIHIKEKFLPKWREEISQLD
jgi:hypothetical protein